MNPASPIREREREGEREREVKDLEECVQLTWWVRIQITLAVHANGNHVSLHKAHKNALIQIPMNPSPPALCDAKFIQESKLVQRFVLSQRGETGIYLSLSLSFPVSHIGEIWSAASRTFRRLPTRSINLFCFILSLLFSFSSSLPLVLV